MRFKLCFFFVLLKVKAGLIAKNIDRCERALQENTDRSLSVNSQSERAYYLSHIIITFIDLQPTVEKTKLFQRDFVMFIEYIIL